MGEITMTTSASRATTLICCLIAAFLASVGHAAESLPGDIDVTKWAAGDPNKRVALNYLQMVNQGKRPDAVRQYAAPTFVNHRSPLSPAAQREANAKAMAAGTQAVPPSASSGAVLKATIGRVIAEGEYVMIHYLVTNNADIGRKLVNASGTEIGSKVGTNVVDIFRIQDGKIVEKWDAIEAIDRVELFD
jgi:predicted SnoaL-like aldol condensation-catalyzing enzyme